jgi:hypothetical protein
MANNLYRINSGDLPMASDIDQFVDTLNGVNDVGIVSLAPQIQPPSITTILTAINAGTALGIGTYLYKFTFIVGYMKTNGSVISGNETNGSASVSVTTTSGNQSVTLSGLPAVTSWPATAIGINIYRTAVGGADGTQKLVGSIYTNVGRSSSQTTFVDNVADGSLTKAVPTSNATGTNLQIPSPSTFPPVLPVGTIITVNGVLYISNGTQWTAQGSPINSVLYWIN